MSTGAEPERLNQEGFEAFSARTGDGAPVVMLNLLAFKPDGGQERYMEYAAAVAPLLGEDPWDMVALVEYPTRQAFLEMTASPEYQAIGHLRTEALVKGELHPMDQADAPSG